MPSSVESRSTLPALRQNCGSGSTKLGRIRRPADRFPRCTGRWLTPSSRDSRRPSPMPSPVSPRQPTRPAIRGQRRPHGSTGPTLPRLLARRPGRPMRSTLRTMPPADSARGRCSATSTRCHDGHASASRWRRQPPSPTTTSPASASRLGRPRSSASSPPDVRTARSGAQLYVSEKTASVHVSNIIRKLGVTTRVEAAAVAQRLGSPDPAIRCHLRACRESLCCQRAGLACNASALLIECKSSRRHAAHTPRSGGARTAI